MAFIGSEHLDFNKIKMIDIRTKTLLFGYIHEAHSLLDTNKNIPDLITYICLSYYYIAEFFTKFGDSIEYDIETCTVTNVSSELRSPATAYGNIALTTYGKTMLFKQKLTYNLYIWKIKVIRNATGYLCIGIDSSNKAYLNRDYANFRPNTKKYAFLAFGEELVYTNDADEFEYDAADTFELSDGDVVEMEIDLRKNTIIFTKAKTNQVCKIQCHSSYFNGSEEHA